MNLYIGNLDYTIKEQQLTELFESIGEVSSVKIITDKMTGRSKGFAFVEMPNDSEAQAAIENLNGKPLRDRQISVTQARPRTENSGGGGGYSNNRQRRY
jgi:RNA recognition motif-containing protein